MNVALYGLSTAISAGNTYTFYMTEEDGRGKRKAGNRPPRPMNSLLASSTTASPTGPKADNFVYKVAARYGKRK